MSLFRSAATAVFALIGSLAPAHAEPPREPRAPGPRGVEAGGHRSEGPGYLIWDESRAEVEDWERVIGTPAGDPPLVCGACRKVHRHDGSWARPAGDAAALLRRASHGLCPACARERFPDLLGDA